MSLQDSDAAADAFFARKVTADLRAKVVAEGGTPPGLLARWERDSARARAADKAATRAVHERERAEAQRRAAEQRASAAAARAKASERTRAWAAAHPQDSAERGRRWAAANPERRREHSRDYYARNKEAIAARAKERRRLDPEGQAKWGRAYREAHREELARKQREKRQLPEVKRQRAEYARAQRRRERRRLDAGLPPPRLYRLTHDQLLAADAAADEFFARTYASAELCRIRAQHGQRTPPELLAAWAVESAAVRRAARLAEGDAAEPAGDVSEVASLAATARQAEELRMDAIARAINDRLRIAPRRRDPFRDSPATPHVVDSATPGRGAGR